MRVKCYKCFWPAQHCWCGSITPMPSRTKFVILMHSYEFKRIKANTGRLTHLCLSDSELFVGEAFDQHEAVQALINDPQNYPVLLYPGRDALDLSKAGNEEIEARSSEQGAGSAEMPPFASLLPAPNSVLGALRSTLLSRRL